MSLLLESNPADTDDEESQNYEHDLQSLTWQNIEIDENKMVAFESVIKDIIKSTDNLPEIIEAGMVVDKTSSGIKWIQNHKEDFERIIGRASILVIVLWQSYKKSKDHSLVWPSPKLRIVIEFLTETVRRIHKLMERKFKNFAKQIFGAYVVRDIGKFKKYERRLDSVAEDLENLNNIKINEVLQEFLDTQHHDNIDPSENPDRGNDSLDKESTQRKADTQDFFAEGFNSQRNAIAAAKPTNRKMTSDEKNEVDQTKYKAPEKIKIQQKNVYDSIVPSFEDVHISENKGTKKKTTTDDDAEEWTSGQGFVTNRAGWMKDRKSLSLISEDKFNTDNGDVPISVTTMGPTKEKKSAKKTLRQNLRRDTAPAQLPVSIGGAHINNHGSGNVYNRDVGNFKGSTISNMGNDNSENHFQLRPYATKGKNLKPALPPRQNTAPASPVSIGGAFVNNYGSGNVANGDVGNIENSNFSNVGNNNSRNYTGIQPRRKRTNTGDGH